MSFLLHGANNYIFFVFYIDSKKYRYSTKIKINRVDWSLKNQRAKVRRGSVGSINRKINDELNEYQRAYNILKDKYKFSLTKDIVKDEFNTHFNLAQIVKTLTVCDYFIMLIQQKHELQSIKPKSLQKYYSVLNHIKEIENINKKKFYLQDLDIAFFNSFISFLRIKKQISDNTLKRKLGIFKSFLNWCVKNKYNVNMIYKDITVKGRETSHISLTSEELNKLEEIELNQDLDYFRDLFLIGCYSGQRYSDYSRFNKKFIDGNNIILRAKKTAQFSYIPLNSKLKRLLDKHDWTLKLISSQKFNKKIQEICKIADFTEIIETDKFYGNKKISTDLPRWRLIGSHSARRSFITLSAQRNVPHSIIMQATGIKSLKTLANYIRFDKDKLNEEMLKAWV